MKAISNLELKTRKIYRKRDLYLRDNFFTEHNNNNNNNNNIGAPGRQISGIRK